MITRPFRVIEGRIHFICPNCKTKRVVAVSPDVRRRSIRCHKCRELSSCNLNRRNIKRDQQGGKVMMFTAQGRGIEVDLYDISPVGVGFEIPSREVSRLGVGSEIYFRCPWNPKILGQGRYYIRSINGRRVGAQRQNQVAF